MGGYGSTRWGGHVRRCTVEDALALEARVLARELRLPAVVGSRTVEVERGRLRGALRRYVVELEAVAQPSGGGVRWWCRCAQCGVLRRALYAKPGQPDAKCRECWDLAYESQRLARDKRLARRARALARTLGAWDVLAAAFARAAAQATGAAVPEIVDVAMAAEDGIVPKRPRGMHRITYRVLRAELQRVLDARDSIMYEDLKKLRDQIRSPRRRP